MLIVQEKESDVRADDNQQIVLKETQADIYDGLLQRKDAPLRLLRLLLRGRQAEIHQLLARCVAEQINAASEIIHAALVARHLDFLREARTKTGPGALSGFERLELGGEREGGARIVDGPGGE